MSKKRAPGRSLDELMELITECRQSGLTDAAWCNEHGISPSCFYNAVTRLRKKPVRYRIQPPKTALLTLHPINRITDEEIVSVSHLAPIHDIGKTVQTKYHQTKNTLFPSWAINA